MSGWQQWRNTAPQYIKQWVANGTFHEVDVEGAATVRLLAVAGAWGSGYSHGQHDAGRESPDGVQACWAKLGLVTPSLKDAFRAGYATGRAAEEEEHERWNTEET